MGRSSMSGLMVGGAVLILLGLIGFAIPIFTTQQTKDVAKTGDLKLQPRNALRMSFRRILSGGALAIMNRLASIAPYS